MQISVLLLVSVAVVLLSHCSAVSVLNHLPINPHALTTTNLSVPRWGLAAVSNRDLLFFGGGFATPAGHLSGVVEIYNVRSSLWLQPVNLSVGRGWLAAASAGDLVLFAGGWHRQSNNKYIDTDVVDIYDVSLMQWLPPTKLSVGRTDLVAVASGDFVFFAGGSAMDATMATTYFSTVDIYDTKSRQWLPPTKLTNGRANIAAAAVRDLVFFAGGYDGVRDSSLVDVYNVTSHRWQKTLLLSVGRTYLAASGAGDIVLFAGGQVNSVSPNVTQTNVVDVYNVQTKAWLPVKKLSVARSQLAAATNGEMIYIGGGANKDLTSAVDVFSAWQKQWVYSTNLSMACRFQVAATAGDSVAFAGGMFSTGACGAVDLFL